MNRKCIHCLGHLALVLALGLAPGLALAQSDREAAITQALEQAGGGRVLSVQQGDGAYSIKVLSDDGRIRVIRVKPKGDSASRSRPREDARRPGRQHRL